VDGGQRFSQMVSAMPGLRLETVFLFDYEKSKAMRWHGDLQMTV